MRVASVPDVVPSLVLAAGWNPILIGVLTAVFLLICVLMVLVVLIQKPQGGGLAAAFGGSSAASGQTAFGAKTGDALTLITIGVFVVYLLLAMGLNLGIRPQAPAADPNATATSGDPAAPADSAAPAGSAAPGATDAVPVPLPATGVTPEGTPGVAPEAMPSATPAVTPGTDPAAVPAPSPSPAPAPAPAPAAP